MDNNEKKYNLRTVKNQLKKLEEKREKKQEDLSRIKSEIKDLDIQIKEAKRLIEKITNDRLKKQVTESLFDKCGLTNEQISKLLELSQKIGKKIDNVDIDSLVDKLPDDTKKVDTYINFAKNKNEGEND